MSTVHSLRLCLQFFSVNRFISTISRFHTDVLSCVLFFATPWIVARQAPCLWNFPGKSTGVRCHFLSTRFHVYALIDDIIDDNRRFVSLTSLCLIGSRFIHLTTTDSHLFLLMVELLLYTGTISALPFLCHWTSLLLGQHLCCHWTTWLLPCSGYCK